jgi:hypothetical protein
MNPPVSLKYQSRVGHVHLCGFFLHPMRGGHCRKFTNDIEGTIMIRISEQVMVFIEASKVNELVSRQPCGLKILKPAAHGHKVPTDSIV